MKKKILLCLLCGIISLSTGCVSKDDITVYSETLDDGTKVEHRESGDTYTMNSIDTPIKYGNSEFYISNLYFYEDYEDYEYSFWLVAEFDLTDMSDEDFHWFQKEADFHLNCSVDSEENSFDSEDAKRWVSQFYSDKYYVAAFDLYEYRYSLSGDSCDLAIYFYSDDTYEYESDDGDVSQLNKSNAYYLFNYPIPENMESVETMPSAIYETICENLAESKERILEIYTD